MASTYEPIATTTLGSNASTVTFSSISGSYTDLILVARMANSNSATSYGPGFTINTDSLSSNKLSFTAVYGNGSSAVSFRWTTSTPVRTVPAADGATSLNGGGMGIVQIMNYSNTTTYKTILSRFGSAGTDTRAVVTLWQDTSAINQIVFYPNDGTNTILSGSTFTLYGIKAA